MSELTIENWNDLISNVGRVADNSQRQLVQVNGYLSELNNTLTVTNIILATIALTLIISLIFKIIEYRKR